jgi:hypothetical protein
LTDFRLYLISLGCGRPGVALAVSLIDRLYGSEEPVIRRGVDLDEIGYRNNAASFQQTGRAFELRVGSNPVIRGSREDRVVPPTIWRDLFEIADDDREVIGRKNLPELGRHRRPDLDSVNKRTFCEKPSSCLSGTRADFEDERSRGKQLAEVCVQGTRVSGSDFVVHTRDVVKRLSPDRSPCHGRKSRAAS